MNSGRGAWGFGFKAALGAIAAVWLVRFIGGILLILIFIGFATGWIFVPFVWLRSCASINEPQFVQDCVIERLETNYIKKTTAVICRDGARYDLADITPSHGPVVRIVKTRGSYIALDLPT